MCTLITAISLIRDDSWRNPRFIQVIVIVAWQAMLGASDRKGEAVRKREPVWEKEEEKLWLLETKRENPKGKIRDITIVGREATAK